MKKILIAFDGNHFSEGAFEFARVLNEKKQILLTGVFLPHIYYANLWTYAGSINDPGYLPMEEESIEKDEENIKRFEDLCTKNHIEFRVHRSLDDLAVAGLKSESRFADLLILGSESFYQNPGEKEPNIYLQESLHRVECPVVVVPEKYDFPDTNILAYDGSESSVYAIKQFACLFPELSGNPTMLVFINRNESGRLPDEIKMEELAARHFPNLEITTVDLDPKTEFTLWLNTKKNAMLISGAYGRSTLSLAFKKSFISAVIKEHKLPIFVTHR